MHIHRHRPSYSSHSNHMVAIEAAVATGVTAATRTTPGTETAAASVTTAGTQDRSYKH